MDFQLGPAYDTKTMEESKIRERIKTLIEKADAEATPQEYGEVMQGTLGLITLLYGSGSKQIASLERAVVEEQKRTLNLWPDQQRGAVTQLAAGALANVLAELDAGLVGSLKQQAAAEVLTDFVALSRAALAEKAKDAKNVSAVLVAAACEDTIRRLGGAHAGTKGGEKLSDVLVALRSRECSKGRKWESRNHT
jgi:hypothetical protein